MNYRKICSGLSALALSALLSTGAAADAGREVLANADIIGLVRAGMAPEVIVAKINNTPNLFDLSSRALISMKENGVPDQVISAMLAAAQNPGARPVLDEARYGRELENIAIGGSEAKAAGIGWMLANRADALPALQKSLADSKPEIRAAALAVLARMRDAGSLPAIRNLLTDSSPLVRRAAAETLAELQDAASINAAELAVSRQVNPLDGYIRLVGYARITRAAGPLGTVLTSNADAINRAAAAWAIGEIGRAGTAGRPALEKALQADADPEVRREAALAIAKFRDAAGATALENACRADPEVRKVTLAAMAEFPESVDFLVGVLNLGPDQIAADELETARASLARLTGQDFGLDGARWSEWFMANRSRFPAGQTAAATPAQPGDTFPGVPPPASQPAVGIAASPTRSQGVDLEAWSIVADPNAIPMAPQAEGGGASSAPPAPAFAGGSLPPPPGGFGGGSSSGMPSSLSPNDFGGAASGFESPSAPVGGDSGQASLFKTWSSEPSRPTPPPSTERRSAAGSVPRGSPATESLFASDSQMPAFPPSPADDQFADSIPASPESGQPGKTATYVSEPTPAPSATARRPASSPAPPPAGISLPLPGMDAGMSGSTGGGDAFAGSDPEGGWEGVVDSHPAPDPFAAPGSFPPTAPFAGGDSSYAAGVPSFDAPDDYAEGGDDLFSQPDMSMFAPSGAPTAETEPSPFATSNMPVPGQPPARAQAGTPVADPYAGMPIPGQGASLPFGVTDDGEQDGSGFAGLPPPPMGGEDDDGPVVSTALDEDEPVPPMPPAATSADGSHLFVEPEPGQMVVGEALFDGVPARSSATGSLPVATGVPVYPAGVPLPPEGAAAELPASDPNFVPVNAPPGTPMVDTRFISPSSDAPAGGESAPSGGGKRRRGRGEPAPSTDRNLEDVYKPYTQQTYQAPVSPSAPVAEQAPLPPATTQAPRDVFSDPSAPLPPVKSEGTIGPGKGGEAPPILGQGMF